MNSESNWGRLSKLCRKMHQLIYVQSDQKTAKKKLPELEGLLEQLPENDIAIIRAEAHALLHTMKGNLELAVEFRRLEVELTHRLHESIRANNQDEDTVRFMLQYRNKESIEEREAIIAELEQQVTRGR